MPSRRQLLLLPVAALAQSRATTALCFNEDHSHFFSTRAGQKLNAESVASFMDQYRGTQIREMILSANSILHQLRQPSLGPDLERLRPPRPGRSAALAIDSPGSPRWRT